MGHEKKKKTESGPTLPDEEILEKVTDAFKDLDISLEDVLAGRLDILDKKSDEADK